MSEASKSLGFSAEGQLGGNWSLGGNAKLDLDTGRLSQFGAQLGWKDPDAFRSFALDYKATWLQENPGYEHQVDAMLEYSMGSWAGRLKAGGSMQAAEISGANADLLVGRQINDDWAVLGGADYQYKPDDLGQGQHNFGVRAGVQYKGVAVTVNYEPEQEAVGLRLEIPLSW